MLDKRGYRKFVVLLALIVILGSFTVEAAVYELDVSGLNPIFLAGRTDITISDPNAGTDDSFPLERPPASSYATYASEKFPDTLPVRGGDEISFEAEGLVRYVMGWNELIESNPDGKDSKKSDYLGVGGISGYKGPRGALVGVFLDGNVPSTEGSAPEAIDFEVEGIQFDTLYPELGQVFFIGDGKKDNDLQTFVAPAGATRVLLGVADGRFYNGKPGYYGDNTGSFAVIAYLPDSAITATVDMKPNKLTLRNRGRYIKAYIEIQDEQGRYDARDIDRSSVMITEVNGVPLDEAIGAVKYSRIGDRDRDGIPDLKVKFSRRKLVPHLSVGENNLTIVGVMGDGTDFEGFGEINAKAKKMKKKCRRKRR